MICDDNISFYKMSGCGNDFIVIDNRDLKLPVTHMASWAKALCKKGFGICADGLFFLDDPPKGEDLSYCWHFFNSDGSEGEMCGNASRCAARLAYEIGLAPPAHTFGTQAGPIRANVFENGPQSGQVEVLLPPPTEIILNIRLMLNGRQLTVHSVVVGVPHVVVLVEDIQERDIRPLGEQLNRHELYTPVGINVNFAQITDENHILLRTYERGVFDETYACGTGAAATHVLLNRLGLIGKQANLTTRGGEILTVSLKGDQVFLQGNAKLTFKGEFYLNAMGLNFPPP